uniref:LOB domain-containing protein n=1 Tax=Picea sitchensis TaxID=3332 RepID=A9P1U3_PICSI|nr:unknown [Picea sitchensis]
MEGKQCLDNCTILYRLASNDLHKFSILQKVFGACNVIKLIQDLSPDQRVDAINSMVYEASARLQDPALGCVGIIQQLQLQISDLQSRITATQATIQKIRSQEAQLVASIPGFNNKFNPTMSTSLNDSDDEDEDLE